MDSKNSLRIRLPEAIKKSDIIEVVVWQKYRSTSGLGCIADTRKVVRTGPAVYLMQMTATYNGKVVGIFLMSSAVSEDPRISFPLRVDAPGTLTVMFESNLGEQFESTREIRF